LFPWWSSDREVGFNKNVNSAQVHVVSWPRSTSASAQRSQKDPIRNPFVWLTPEPTSAPLKPRSVVAHVTYTFLKVFGGVSQRLDPKKWWQKRLNREKWSMLGLVIVFPGVSKDNCWIYIYVCISADPGRRKGERARE
jgi:hypothetical protein